MKQLATLTLFSLALIMATGNDMNNMNNMNNNMGNNMANMNHNNMGNMNNNNGGMAGNGNHSGMNHENHDNNNDNEHSGGHDHGAVEYFKLQGPEFILWMPMFFFSGTEVTFLFPELHSENGTGYAAGWLACFFISILVEGLLFLRSYLALKFQE